MPTYLLQGFRWPRSAIRIHIIVQNLDDAAPEWLMAPLTTQALLHNFSSLYPNIINRLPNLRFIEQYDPSDESSDCVSQPYAFVSNTVYEIKLSLDIQIFLSKCSSSPPSTKPSVPKYVRKISSSRCILDSFSNSFKKSPSTLLPNPFLPFNTLPHPTHLSAISELRDQLAPSEPISWFIVVCGDIERQAPSSSFLHTSPSLLSSTSSSSSSPLYSHHASPPLSPQLNLPNPQTYHANSSSNCQNLLPSHHTPLYTSTLNSLSQTPSRTPCNPTLTSHPKNPKKWLSWGNLRKIRG